MKNIYGLTQQNLEQYFVDNGEKSLKRWAITEIYLFDNCFAHKSLGTYFEEKGANKYFTLAQGKEWTGGDCLDDNC